MEIICTAFWSKCYAIMNIILETTEYGEDCKTKESYNLGHKTLFRKFFMHCTTQ